MKAARLWLLVALGLVALGLLYYFLATVGPKRVGGSATVVTAPDDPAIARLSDEITALEKQYQQAADANVVTTESTEALAQAVDKQKELLRTFSKADLDQSTRLVRLETELDSVRARGKVLLVDRLEKDGEELLTAGKVDEAGEKLREALRLQKEVNLSAASSRYKNYVRETSLTQAVAAVEAAPLKKEMQAALVSARQAATDQRWADALTAYTAARDMQARINREYGRTRYADLAGADRLSAEIESLNAAGIATEIDVKEKAGDDAVINGRSAEAAVLFNDAENLQLQVNQNYPRSRFVSSQRIENLEIKRQTALSSDVANSLEELDRAIGVHLRKRQIVAAEQQLGEAGQLVEKLFKDYPKSRRLDGALRIKFAYLALRRSDLRALQDEVYDRLLPLPGVSNWLLLKTEVPQSLYVLVMNTNPSRNPGRSLPVDSVSWNDAQEFCTRLSWLLGTTVRLPSADEFRVALGGESAFETWNSRNSGGHSHEVGRQKTNASGFADLLGNLGEWSAADATDSRAPVVGGSYLDEPEALLKVPSEPRLKSDRARHVGLRILVEL
ncbi:SUMF1/EgtB/PvdO family nonheme iron enzyme [Rariglobus hedericola]|uniref:SUMF1/EgtB/PvdO family nonheme iron enzyme n=1 Tax=Rariglobus hedericola TaxID=2597822 RepID=UPI0039E88922